MKGLDMGTYYFVRARACNSQGCGTARASLPASLNPQQTPPQPATVTLQISSESLLTLGWTPPQHALQLHYRVVISVQSLLHASICHRQHQAKKTVAGITSHASRKYWPYGSVPVSRIIEYLALEHTGYLLNSHLNTEEGMVRSVMVVSVYSSMKSNTIKEQISLVWTEEEKC